MSSRRVFRASRPTSPPVVPSFLIGQMIAVAGLALLLIVGRPTSAEASVDAPTATLSARMSSGMSLDDRRQYVYTMGEVAQLRPDALTLRFEAGQMETYRVGPSTTIHDQDGTPQNLTDLKVGDLVIVITEENDTTAVTIVSSDGRDLDTGGPYDIGDLD